MKMLLVIFAEILVVIISPTLRAEEDLDLNHVLLDHPQSEKFSFSFDNDLKILSLVGSPGDTSDAIWLHWEKNSHKLSFKNEVKSIFLNYGYISEASLNYLTSFRNVESIILGISIEGVAVSPAGLRVLSKFQNLEVIAMAIHGLNKQHLKSIAEVKNIKHLSIQFPSSDMILDRHKSQKDLWRPVNLGDDAAEEIGKIISLESISINHAPDGRDGQVIFSEKSLQALIKLPNLKSLFVSSDIFTKEGMKEIESLDLPSFVRFSE